MTRLEWQAQAIKDWRRVHLNFFADCIEHVLPHAANAPAEYQKMVTLIRQVGDGVADRQTAKTTYRGFIKSLKKWKFKYSPEGEIGKVIATALNWARSNKAPYYGNWLVWPCVEATMIIAKDSEKEWEKESDWQSERYHKMGLELDKYNGGWKAHKKEYAAAAA